MLNLFNNSIVYFQYIIGASLSEPHTRELGGEISVCMLVSVGLRAQIRGKMFAWSCQNNY